MSYPASQNGGSVSYSGSEPVYITIDVDTNAFDASVGHCNNAVNALTGAVVATEAAQVESKRQASKQIASTIVKGFFDYVGADLSQKIKELSSKCESLFIALMGHKDNCLSKSKQMQDDYNRISKRYSKIFEDLDKETVSRIEVLDKPTFQFAESAQNLVDRNSNTELLGISTISANENIKLETVLSCSHVKQQASVLLDKANCYLQGTYRLANSVRDMLDDSQAENDILLPVMFVESVKNIENKETRIIGTDDSFTPSGDAVDSTLRSKFMSKDVEWGNMNSNDFDKVISYLNAEVQSDQMDDRTLKTMLGLLNGQAIQTIKA
ncbi:MAG: hypothetical protein UDS46_02950 [Bacteroidales bacterium]|nr:hypothetical protein [Bacteroidales bacterium]